VHVEIAWLQEGGSPADGQSASRLSTDSTQESPAGWRPMGRSQVSESSAGVMGFETELIYNECWQVVRRDDCLMV